MQDATGQTASGDTSLADHLDGATALDGDREQEDDLNLLETQADNMQDDYSDAQVQKIEINLNTYSFRQKH